MFNCALPAVISSTELSKIQDPGRSELELQFFHFVFDLML